MVLHFHLELNFLASMLLTGVGMVGEAAIGYAMGVTDLFSWCEVRTEEEVKP